ncbi:sigma-70 family RNA polymerase sigma factor [Streptomyces spectabilis]|uniref:RNA polymerase sigma factor n=1 Tax=Streptomyces spectabilis TaxID=68270 RepID=UPI0033E2ED7E
MSHQLIGKISTAGDAEAELIARARAGDRDAFAALYTNHREDVYGYLVVRTRDRHLAEDLTQDVFVRALRRLETFGGRGANFAAWLTTIARNLHVDHVRSHRVKREVPVAELPEGDARDRSAETSALRELDIAEATETVATAMRVLTTPQRQCVRLRFFDDLSVRETADRMGKHLNAAKTLQHRALRGMQRFLTAEETA